jgi:hypothetical protein
MQNPVADLTYFRRPGGRKTRNVTSGTVVFVRRGIQIGGVESQLWHVELPRLRFAGWNRELRAGAGFCTAEFGVARQNSALQGGIRRCRASMCRCAAGRSLCMRGILKLHVWNSELQVWNFEMQQWNFAVQGRQMLLHSGLARKQEWNSAWQDRNSEMHA